MIEKNTQQLLKALWPLTFTNKHTCMPQTQTKCEATNISSFRLFETEEIQLWKDHEGKTKTPASLSYDSFSKAIISNCPPDTGTCLIYGCQQQFQLFTLGPCNSQFSQKPSAPSHLSPYYLQVYFSYCSDLVPSSWLPQQPPISSNSFSSWPKWLFQHTSHLRLIRGTFNPYISVQALTQLQPSTSPSHTLAVLRSWSTLCSSPLRSPVLVRTHIPTPDTASSMPTSKSQGRSIAPKALPDYSEPSICSSPVESLWPSFSRNVFL